MDCNTANWFSPLSLLAILGFDHQLCTTFRSPLPWILGGCAVLFLCATLALAANAVFWVTRARGASANPPPAQGGIQAAVEALPEGDASSGETIFREGENCQSCHSIDSSQRGAGPSLSGVSVRAGEEKPGYSAEMYLYESIVYPNAHTVAGYPGGIMPGNYRKSLSDQQLADLIAFLMTK